MGTGVTYASKLQSVNIQEALPSLDRNDEEFLKKSGKRKAFHVGGNSSCRQHIHRHYAIYQERCKAANIPEHHWAIPRIIWNRMEDERKGKKVEMQGTLDGFVEQPVGPIVYMCENILHAVTQFVAVDDQVCTHQ